MNYSKHSLKIWGVTQLTKLLSYYQIIYLAKCQLIVSIPSSWAHASKLLELDFYVNKFTENIPTCEICYGLNFGVTILDTVRMTTLDFVNSVTNHSSL